MQIRTGLSCAVAAAIGLGLGAAPALAQDNGFYVGAAVGGAKYPRNGDLSIGPGMVVRGRVDKNEDFAWSLAAGYRFNRYLAVEAAYVDLGEASGTLSETEDRGIDFDATLDVAFSARGPMVSLIGTYPLGDWEPYVKAGVLFADTKLSVAGTVNGEAGAASVKGDSEDIVFAIGIGRNLSPRWQLKLDASYADDVGESDSGRANILMLSLGSTYRF
jgi:opacity protein-like surface antigen